MDEGGDKMATIRENASPKRRSKKAGPFFKVKAGSAVVPIYRAESKGRVRFTLSFYRDGRRMRKMFNDLDKSQTFLTGCSRGFPRSVVADFLQRSGKPVRSDDLWGGLDWAGGWF